MSLLAQGVIAIALLGVQEGKGDPNQKPTSQSDDLFYAMFRAETEKRDFAESLESWTHARQMFELANRKDLVLKAELGRARCLQALGRSVESKAAVKQVLAADPKNAEATALLAKLEAAGVEGDELKEIVRQLADVALSLTSAQDEKCIEAARTDLIRMSDVAVPQLADLLHENRVGVVNGAASLLNEMKTSRAFDALAAALSDPHCRYPSVLVEKVTSKSTSLAAQSFYEAMVARPEPEFRLKGVSCLTTCMGDLAADAQVTIVKRLMADANERIRNAAAGHQYGADVARPLVPVFQAFVDAKDEASLKLGAEFLSANRETLPSDVVGRWSAQLAGCPIASIRVWMLGSDYDAAWKQQQYTGDSKRRALLLLRLLSDDEATVFLSGVVRIENGGRFSAEDLPTGSHDGLMAALNHAIELSGVSLPKRYVVLMQLPLKGLSEDELFEVFGRLAVKPVDADAEWRATIRERVATELLGRHGDGGGRDAFAAKWLLKIADAEGRRQWFALTPSRNNNYCGQSALEAVKADDVVLRTLAYRELKSGVTSSLLPHVAEDLRSDDPAVVLAAVRAIGWGERPDLVAPLRQLLTRESGELHDAALSALAKVGGKEAADELLAAMKATAKERNFEFLRELERGIGAERLAQELVAVAVTQGTSERVLSWMRSNGVAVSGDCASSFVRLLPENLVSSAILDSLTSVLSPDVLGPLVRRRLREGRGYELESVASLAGRYHIEAAWPELVALLDTGAGQAREQAIAALKSLREYRELKRTFAADDSDARRAAFDKAVAMTKSKNSEQRRGAAIALAATGDVAAISPLLDLLSDGDESVKVAALKALEKLADRAMVVPVEAAKTGEEKAEKKSGH